MSIIHLINCEKWLCQHLEDSLRNSNTMYLKDKYPNFEVGLKCILMVFPYLLLCSYINENAM